MYERECSTKQERDEAAAWAAAKLHDHHRTLLLHAFGEEVCGKWKENGIFERFVQDALDSYRKLVSAEQYTLRRKSGVETRNGSHNRIARLRCGERLDQYGESMDRWFVIDVPEGWLDAIKRRAGDPEVVGEDRYGYAAQDYLEEKLSELTRDEYGYEVGSTHNTADYSPTGRWFSSVYSRQVGTRLLVTEHNYLDC